MAGTVINASLSTNDDFTLNDKELEQKMREPFQYIISLPGKRIRVSFIDALNYWSNIPEDKLTLIKDIVDISHNLGLVVDDIQDNSRLRRGAPTTHRVFGLIYTIISVDYMWIVCRDKVLELNNPEAFKIALMNALDIMRGQGMELYWRENFICPSEEEYNAMALGKTGALFFLIVDLMALFCKVKKDVAKLATVVTLYFQINDDYLNLTDQVYHDKKGFCDDLGEGKFSFPIIHAINNFPEEGKKIVEILRERTDDVERKKYCLSLINKCGSFEYTRNALRKYKEIALEEIAKLGENPILVDFIEKEVGLPL